jgi:hypothetical protein
VRRQTTTSTPQTHHRLHTAQGSPNKSPARGSGAKWVHLVFCHTGLAVSPPGTQQAHHPSAEPQSWLRAARRTRMKKPRQRNAPRPVSPSLKRGASGLVSMSETPHSTQTKAPLGGGAKLGLHACSGLPSLRREECVSKPTDSTPRRMVGCTQRRGKTLTRKSPARREASGAKSTMRGRRECKERQPQRYNTTVGRTAQLALRGRQELLRTTSRPASSKPTNC